MHPLHPPQEKRSSVRSGFYRVAGWFPQSRYKPATRIPYPLVPTAMSPSGFMTPADVHHGEAEQRVAARATVLATAYAAHLERFRGGLPARLAYPTEVWINSPETLGRSSKS